MMTFNDIKARFKQDKRLAIILIIGILGMLLLLISSLTESGSAADVTQNAEATAKNMNSAIEISVIENNLENKLKNMISEIKGAGDTYVMVTLSSAGDVVYAENEKKAESDNSSSLEKEIVIYNPTSNSDSGLIVRVDPPEILGVAVVCDGGDSAVVASEIKKMVTSLFGIGSDKVYVGAKSTK